MKETFLLCIWNTKFLFFSCISLNCIYYITHCVICQHYFTIYFKSFFVLDV
nr:MAG TPA: hypothetical protein [Caudoviricetes sp.]